VDNVEEVEYIIAIVKQQHDYWDCEYKT
jgi:hypothetical protein